MVTKKVRQISGNTPSGEVKLEVVFSHSSARRAIGLKPWWVIKNGKELLWSPLFPALSANWGGVTLTLLSYGGCVALLKMSAVTEASSRCHTGFTGNGAAVVGSVQPRRESSVQQPELGQRTQDVYLTKNTVTNRIKKEGKGELHNPSKTPPNNFETHIFGEEHHGHRHQGNVPAVTACCAVFFDSSPSHSDHIYLQICLCVCF